MENTQKSFIRQPGRKAEDSIRKMTIYKDSAVNAMKDSLSANPKPKHWEYQTNVLDGFRMAIESIKEDDKRLPAAIFAVNVGCWSHRRGHIIFDKDLNYTITTHSGVTL